MSEFLSEIRSAPTTKRIKVKVQVFSPMSEIISESSFLIKSYIIIVQKRIVERFGPYKKSKKVDFPLYFFNGFSQCREIFYIRALKLVRTVHIYHPKDPQGEGKVCM